jgi:hypothetical protein
MFWRSPVAQVILALFYPFVRILVRAIAQYLTDKTSPDREIDTRFIFDMWSAVYNQMLFVYANTVEVFITLLLMSVAEQLIEAIKFTKYWRKLRKRIREKYVDPIKLRHKEKERAKRKAEKRALQRVSQNVEKGVDVLEEKPNMQKALSTSVLRQPEGLGDRSRSRRSIQSSHDTFGSHIIEKDSNSLHQGSSTNIPKLPTPPSHSLDIQPQGTASTDDVTCPKKRPALPKLKDTLDEKILLNPFSRNQREVASFPAINVSDYDSCLKVSAGNDDVQIIVDEVKDETPPRLRNSQSSNGGSTQSNDIHLDVVEFGSNHSGTTSNISNATSMMVPDRKEGVIGVSRDTLRSMAMTNSNASIPKKKLSGAEADVSYFVVHDKLSGVKKKVPVALEMYNWHLCNSLSINSFAEIISPILYIVLYTIIYFLPYNQEIYTLMNDVTKQDVLESFSYTGYHLIIETCLHIALRYVLNRKYGVDTRTPLALMFKERKKFVIMIATLICITTYQVNVKAYGIDTTFTFEWVAKKLGKGL